jgi:peroxiredoxin
MSLASHAVTRRTALACLAVAASPAWALQVGQQAPDFELAGRQGMVRLADFVGKTVYLDFWASWCGPCRLSFPWMNEMQTRHGAQGLQIVAINLDRKAADAAAFLARLPAGFLIAFDEAGKTPRSYGVSAMPSSFLIGPDGRVLAAHRGFEDADRAEREQQIRLGLRGRQEK